MERINFEIEQVDWLEETNESQFATAKIHAFSSGENRHEMTCSEEVLRETASSLYYKPILYSYSRMLDDLASHQAPERSLIAGFVSPDSAEFVPLPDGRLALTVMARLWKRYAPKVIEIFSRDAQKKKKASVEMELYESRKLPGGMTDMLKFVYTGICLLGDYITEASPGASAQMISFSREKEEFIEAVQKEFGTDSQRITFPYDSLQDANPAIRGIDPPVTLAQANAIARQAEAVGTDEKVNGWAVAISSFEKTHHVEDGKWVKNKEGDGKEMAVEEEKITCDAPPDEKPEEEEKEEEQKEQEEEKKEGEEEMACESEKMCDQKMGEEEKMSAEKNELSLFNFGNLSTLFSNDSDEFKFLVEQLESKNTDYQKVYDLMFSTMVASRATISQLQEEKTNLLAQNAELKAFKQKVEKEHFDYEVGLVLKDVERYFSVDEIEELRSDSANYALDVLEGWKNKVRSRAFEVAKTQKPAEKEVVRIPLPFSGKSKETHSLWK